ANDFIKILYIFYKILKYIFYIFFFQAEDGIRVFHVTGVQTCALPIYIKLFKKPVLEIESIQMYYGDYPMYKIPKDWLRVDQLTGQIQLFPTSGSAGGLIIDARGSLFTPLVQGRFGYAPQMWEVKYKAGI